MIECDKCKAQMEQTAKEEHIQSQRSRNQEQQQLKLLRDPAK